VTNARTPYDVYVDEAGDRGWGGLSSPVFVLSAVVVKRIDDVALRAGLLGINTAMSRPVGNVLHWAQNLREHSDRKFVAGELARLPADFINVVVCKDSLMGSGSALAKPSYQYNYPMRRLLERVSWLMDGSDGVATLRLAHVRRFKYETLHNYLDYLAVDRDCRINWATLKNGTRPKIEQPSQRRGLQVADLVAGCVYAAVRTDRHGGQEPQYLQSIAPRLWTGPTKKLETYGLHFISGRGHECGTHNPWLPALRSLCT
jgi:Protein of unknown function (DUF3800)